AYHFDVQKIDGNDMVAFLNAFEKAKSATSGKPQIIIAKTMIGKGIPEVEGTNKAHGEGGYKFVDSARKSLGLPEEKFYVSGETRAYFDEHKKTLADRCTIWKSLYEDWRAANPELAKLLDSGL